MEPTLKNLFQSLPQEPLPPHLETKILLRIQRAQNTRETLVLFAFGSLGACSLLALGGAIFYLRDGLIASGIFSYLSLILSEGVSSSAFLKELVLTILEALPLTALSLTLLFLVTTLTSFKKFMEEVPNSFFTIKLS